MAWAASPLSSSAPVTRMPNCDPGRLRPHQCATATPALHLAISLNSRPGHQGSSCARNTGPTVGMEGGGRCVPGQQQWTKSRVLSSGTAGSAALGLTQKQGAHGAEWMQVPELKSQAWQCLLHVHARTQCQERQGPVQVATHSPKAHRWSGLRASPLGFKSLLCHLLPKYVPVGNLHHFSGLPFPITQNSSQPHWA